MERFRLTFEGKRDAVLLVQPSYTLGRSQLCDIVLTGATVAAIHASIVQAGDKWFVVDWDGVNDTFVNGEPVKRQVLRPGDTIRLNGSEVVHFDLAPEDEPPACSIADNLHVVGQHLEATMSLAAHLADRVETVEAGIRKRQIELFKAGKVVQWVAFVAATSAFSASVVSEPGDLKQKIATALSEGDAQGTLIGAVLTAAMATLSKSYEGEEELDD